MRHLLVQMTICCNIRRRYSKRQIMRLLGKYRDQKGRDFRLGQFHDDLIKNGSLPLSIIEWIVLNDRSSLDQATK